MCKEKHCLVFAPINDKRRKIDEDALGEEYLQMYPTLQGNSQSSNVGPIKGLLCLYSEQDMKSFGMCFKRVSVKTLKGREVSMFI